MYQGARGLKYYITFQAKIDDNSDTTTTDDNNSGATKTFEGLVLKGIPKQQGDDATQVIFCREKDGKIEGEELKNLDEGAIVEEAEENEDEEGGCVEEEAQVGVEIGTADE
ncbi:hypothetical protein PTKIN_Ptkin19aG0071700 [Pterospermum kingtungense]